MDENTPGRRMTFGEKAVGLSFNPGGDPKVDEIKKLYARIIDICNDEIPAATQIDYLERTSLFRTAIKAAQGAQMWAVKAITWRD